MKWYITEVKQISRDYSEISFQMLTGHQIFQTSFFLGRVGQSLLAVLFFIFLFIFFSHSFSHFPVGSKHLQKYESVFQILVCCYSSIQLVVCVECQSSYLMYYPLIFVPRVFPVTSWSTSYPITSNSYQCFLRSSYFYEVRTISAQVLFFAEQGLH